MERLARAAAAAGAPPAAQAAAVQVLRGAAPWRLANPCRGVGGGEHGWLDPVQPEWRPGVVAAAAACGDVFGDRLVAVCLRGSVPRGAAVAGISDLDVVCVYWDADGLGAAERPLLRRQLADAFARRVEAEAPTSAAAERPWTRLDVRTIPLAPASAAGRVEAARRRRRALADDDGDEGGDDDEELGAALELALPGAWAHVLKTQAVAVDVAASPGGLGVSGVDLPALLPAAAAAFRPRALAGLAPRLQAALGEAEALQAAGDRAGAARRVRWGLRQTLRAAVELQALAGPEPAGFRLFSRDLFHCAALAGAEWPRLRPALARATAQALDADLHLDQRDGRDVDRLAAAAADCAGLGAWLAAEAGRRGLRAVVAADAEAEAEAAAGWGPTAAATTVGAGQRRPAWSWRRAAAFARGAAQAG